ncbi:cyclic nucleotide-binding domain-containing protein [Sebaldella sp. S0638]|uniref:cyclic nucleotide-binding domain-containing protein n=1 Tax=Sebaldella sp. S0638 TaxID=2957809 RepID=UPI0020A06DAE|nr:cyclic nucleotide-binding domain-containing protein [Sebaldella sp. S0638]MCP1226586.1 cyclic nucleotide-binding domain-containing protein [Sebaldella sp. S0638]
MKKILFNEYYDEDIKKNKTLMSYYSKESLNNSYIIEFANNEFIQEEDRSVNFLYFIIQGKAKILKNQANGKRMILQFLKEEDFIGDLTVIGAEKVTKDVLSIGNTVCLATPVNYVIEILMEDRFFLKKISRYIGEKLLSRMDFFVDNQTYELKYRLAEVMLTVSINNVYKENHLQIAEYLGVSYRHLLHTMKKFKDEKKMYKEGSKYIIDREKLELLVNEKNGL